MRTYKPKQCTKCNNTYIPTGQCSKYCNTCRIIAEKENQFKGQEAYRRRQGMEIGYGRSEKNNNNFKHGMSVFARWAREQKELNGVCNFCKRDLKTATHYEWVGHHKDHNRENNTKENLILLCKKCHQLEHKCWKNFEGVTTSRKT
jgi:hypothetical protein